MSIYSFMGWDQQARLKTQLSCPIAILNLGMAMGRVWVGYTHTQPN